MQAAFPQIYTLNMLVVLVIQSCLTLCDPVDYSLPGSPVRGMSQAAVLEWVAISFSTEYVILAKFSWDIFFFFLSQGGGWRKENLTQIGWEESMNMVNLNQHEEWEWKWDFVLPVSKRFKVAQVTHQDVPLVKHSASGLLPTHLKRPGGADLHSAHTEVEWGF